MNVYLYELGDCLYINLTNRCSNNCTFCLRNNVDGVGGNRLWLDKEPEPPEIIEGFNFIAQSSNVIERSAAALQPWNFLKNYRQVVFCGFGEPTYRMDCITAIGQLLRGKGCYVRLDTNGQGRLINGRDIVPELAVSVDAVSVSLNASSAKKYNDICRPANKNAYAEVLNFAAACKKAGIDTTLSVVDAIGEKEIEACKKLAESRGLPFKIRKYIK